MRFFVTPLVQYHPTQPGYTSNATLAPVGQHLVEYDWALSQAFGMGIASNIRAISLYDDDKSKTIISKWVKFAKTYREVLGSPFITLQFTNQTGVDIILHRAPEGYYPTTSHRALAMLWNTQATEATLNVSLPLYYAGLQGSARVRQQEGEAMTISLDGNCTGQYTVTVPAMEITYLVVEA